MTTVQDLIQSIDGRLHELGGEIIRLEDARTALANGSAKPAPKVEADGIQSKPRGKPKTKVLLAGQLEQILRDSSDGLSTAAIAAKGNADPTQALTLLRELEKTGQVRRTGKRRGTRWHVFTDENRIAERAAELESRSQATI